MLQDLKAVKIWFLLPKIRLRFAIFVESNNVLTSFSLFVIANKVATLLECSSSLENEFNRAFIC